MGKESLDQSRRLSSSVDQSKRKLLLGQGGAAPVLSARPGSEGSSRPGTQQSGFTVDSQMTSSLGLSTISGSDPGGDKRPRNPGRVDALSFEANEGTAGKPLPGIPGDPHFDGATLT